MSNLVKLETSYIDEAGDWIAKLDRGLSQDEEAELGAWLDADPENYRMLSRMALLWDNMDALSRLSGMFPHPAEGPARPTVKWAALAASVLLVAGGALLTGLWPGGVATSPNSSDANTFYETAVGGLSTIELSDNSEIALNTNSRIQVDFGDEQRLIHLERGELHIEVAHDPQRPLGVVVGDRIVQAVGTAFNVRLNHPRKIEVLVTEGNVQVGAWSGQGGLSLQGIEAQPASAVRQAADVISVSKGERAVFLADQEDQVDRLPPGEIEAELSWRKGNLIFKGETLEEVVAEIGRYTPVEFVIRDESLGQIPIGGFFTAGDVAGFLVQLERNFDITHTRIHDNKIQLVTRSSE